MNVYEKLNQARVDFKSKGIKQNGQNKFAGYTYFELADILPATNEICNALKATCVIRFENEMAFLDFIDCEKPEDKITFTSPMSEASLKGCHAVQNLGAVESYIKRYLYQNAFEISESGDVLDGTMNPNDRKPFVSQRTASPEINKMKSQIMDAITRGDLKGDYEKRARDLMNANDEVGIRRILDYLAGQEQKVNA